MAHTVISPSSLRRPARPRFMSISPAGKVESMLGPRRNGNGVLSPVLQDKVETAKRHYKELGAEQVCRHSLRVLKAAIEGKLLDPHADESDMLSMELADQILYHSLTSEGHFPSDASFSSRFLDTFELQRRLNDLDSAGGERSAAYVELLNDPSNDLTNLLVAFYTRIADMMTVHDRATIRASKTRMPGVFPVHHSWTEVQKAWAEPMLSIYCPVADWGGQTHAYRQMRDNAMLYRYPEYFQEVAAMVQRKTGALEATNKFVLGVVQTMARRLGLRVLVAEDYRVVSKLFEDIGPQTVAVALKPFKGVGGLLNKALKRDLPVEKIHDWAGLTVITSNTEQMYDAVSFLNDGGIREVASRMSLPDVHVDEPKDYAANPKPVTNYESVHEDVVTSQDGMVNSEFIVRTLDMHKKADEGEANHDGYKESPLVNGERKRFMQRLAEISASD